MRNWIEFPRIEGETRARPADLPQGAFEREIGRRRLLRTRRPYLSIGHPPTCWDLVSRATAPARLLTPKAAGPAGRGRAPLEGAFLLGNVHCAMSIWSLASAMTHLVRDSDGDLLLFVHDGRRRNCSAISGTVTRVGKDGQAALVPRGSSRYVAFRPDSTSGPKSPEQFSGGRHAE